MAAWEPTATIAMRDVPDARILHRVRTFGFTCFSHEFFEGRPAILELLIAAQIRAMRWFDQNPGNLDLASAWAMASGKALTGEDVLLDAEDLSALAKKDLLGLTSSPTIPASIVARHGHLEREFQFLRNESMVANDTAWDGVRSAFDLDRSLRITQQSELHHLDEFQYAD